MISSGLPAWMTFSSAAGDGRILLETSRMYGSSRTASLTIGSVTK